MGPGGGQASWGTATEQRGHGAGGGKGRRETDVLEGWKELLGAGRGQAQARVLTLEPENHVVSSLS